MEKKKNPFGTIDANENVLKNVEGIINIEQPYEQPAEEKKPVYSSYDDIYKMLSEQKAANDAQAADADRRARLAKTQEAIGGIYDLGRSIANLYGTTQYAPNINMESMSDKARARYDKAVAERKAYRDAAMNYLLQQNRMKNNERALDLQQAEQERKLNADETQAIQKEQERKEKEEADGIKMYVDTNKNLWISYYREPEKYKNELDEVRADAERRLNNGEISQKSYNTIISALDAARGYVAAERTKPVTVRATAKSKDKPSSRPTSPAASGAASSGQQKTSKQDNRTTVDY